MEAQQLVEALIREIVDYPEQVSCQAISGSRTSILELQVDPRDVGKVIGRGGAHADALRTLLLAIGGKHGVRYTLEIPEDRSRNRQPRDPEPYRRPMYQRKRDDN